MIFVTHDFGIVAKICDRVAVMYAGRIVEIAGVRDLFNKPVYPYTVALIAAALRSRRDTPHEEVVLPGEVPSPLNPPPECAFHPRCSRALPLCSKTTPVLQEQENGHWIACHLAETAALANDSSFAAEDGR